MRNLLPLLFVCLAGCNKTSEPAPAPPAPPAQPAPAQVQPQPDTGTRPKIPKVDAEIVDKDKYLAANPHVREIQPPGQTPEEKDPWRVYSRAYVTIPSRVKMDNFKHQLDLFKAGSDDNKYLPYAEYVSLVKQMDVDFEQVLMYQLYGYDRNSGALVLLEDVKKKKEVFEKFYNPFPPEDQQFLDALEKKAAPAEQQPQP